MEEFTEFRGGRIEFISVRHAYCVGFWFMAPVHPILVSTFLYALAATVCVLLVSIPLGYAISRYRFPGRRLLVTLMSLPLVLPPTAVGYLLLRLLADGGPLGRDTLGFDPGILFTPSAVVLACSVMSFPLVLRTVRISFEETDPGLEQMAYTLGIGPIRTFVSVTLPLAFRGLIAAAILGFTRAVGEFGATIIIAGNIPGSTQTLASAIFSAQQAGDQNRADFLVAVALGFGFAAVFVSEWLTRPRTNRS